MGDLPVAAVVAVALAIPGVAAAEQAPARTAQTSPSPCDCSAADPGDRLHDGFFARSDTGLAFLWADVRRSAALPRRTGIRAIGQSSSISVGGTPERGLVVGGTAWAARLDPEFIENGVTVVPDDDSVKISILRLGPFLDWYPDPRGGFHAQIAAAFTAQFESDVKGNVIMPEALGAALSAGAGYEWFLASQLSIGALGRLTLGRVVRHPADGEEHVLWFIPELSLTATYH